MGRSMAACAGRACASDARYHGVGGKFVALTKKSPPRTFLSSRQEKGASMPFTPQGLYFLSGANQQDVSNWRRPERGLRLDGDENGESRRARFSEADVLRVMTVTTLKNTGFPTGAAIEFVNKLFDLFGGFDFNGTPGGPFMTIAMSPDPVEGLDGVTEWDIGIRQSAAEAASVFQPDDRPGLVRLPVSMCLVDIGALAHLARRRGHRSSFRVPEEG